VVVEGAMRPLAAAANPLQQHPQFVVRLGVAIGVIVAPVAGVDGSGDCVRELCGRAAGASEFHRLTSVRGMADPSRKTTPWPLQVGQGAPVGPLAPQTLPSGQDGQGRVCPFASRAASAQRLASRFSFRFIVRYSPSASRVM
jgi:hypothetical protein